MRFKPVKDKCTSNKHEYNKSPEVHCKPHIFKEPFVCNEGFAVAVGDIEEGVQINNQPCISGKAVMGPDDGC